MKLNGSGYQFMKKKKRITKKTFERETCIYCIEILDWELPYFFAANYNKQLIEGPLWEHMDLKIDGKLIHPEKLADKSIEVTIIGNRKLVPVVEKPEDYRRFEPGSVATLTVRGEQREFLGRFRLMCLVAWVSYCNQGKLNFLYFLGMRSIVGKLTSGQFIFKGISGQRI